MNFSGKLPGWRAHWSPEKLAKKHRSIGDRSWLQGFRMKAYADSDYLLPNFKKALELGRYEEIPNPFPSDWVTGMGVDLSSAKRPGNGLFCAAISPEGRFRPVEIRLLKASSPQVAKAIGQMSEKWQPQFIMVENNAYQGALIEWIQEYPEKFAFWPEIVAFQTGQNKADPVLGLPGLDVGFLNGQWSVPKELNLLANEHEMACECASCVWARQALNHPHSAQIDLLMAMWFFREGARMYRRGAMDAVARNEVYEPTTDGIYGIPEDELGS